MAESVKLITGLRWKLLSRSFKNNWNVILTTGLLMLYGLMALVGYGAFLVYTTVSGTYLTNEFFFNVARVGVLIAVLWLSAAFFSLGGDSALDARRFATFGRSAKSLQKPLLIAAAISIPFWVLAVVVVVQTVFQLIWGFQLLGTGALNGLNVVLYLIVLIPASAAGLLLMLLITQTISAWRVGLRLSKRKRELLTALSIVALIIVAYGTSLLFQAADTDLLTSIVEVGGIFAEILSWTPLGGAFAIAPALGSGDFLGAILRVFVLCASAVILWKLWEVAFERGQQMALSGSSETKAAKVTALVPRWLPQNALGAVAGKALRYWRRDIRYSLAILLTPVMAAFFIMMSVVQDTPFMGFMGVLIVAWMGGLMLANEIGQDGPSSWVNITAGINNRANLLGRYVAAGSVMAPMVCLAAIIVPVLHKTPQYIGVILPLALGFLLGCWGVAMLVSVYLPYPAPEPGSAKNSGGGDAIISSFAAMFLVFVPSLPALIVIGVGIFTENLTLMIGGAALALVIGALTFYIALIFAAKRLDSHYDIAFQKTKTFTS
ncbi:hypothetical protein [Canibacter zhoujuaniae]|uniref:hypothetical protein n=1 Tax=Canibacter zhoujuaniae TaxID=2708343 RepID=UPI00142263FE|nr:hypothetical protein [Canibacter zhoujuaniae]